MTRNQALQQLMLGLIYPAVLGAVLYAVIGAGLTPFIGMALGQPISSAAGVVKWILLLTTVIFYCFDYLYIMFTREFRPLFFACDLLLLAGLYLSVIAIDINTGSLLARNMIVIGSCYIGFMVLYLAWVYFERFNTDDTTEKGFYNKVILWEVVSLVSLVGWLGSTWLIQNQTHQQVVLTAILVAVTVWFGILTIRKRAFYRSTATDHLPNTRSRQMGAL